MATSKWFDADVYMDNKLAQLKAQDPEGGWTLDKVYNAFRDAGFVGTEGQYEHFVQYGADEEVAPNAYFDADEYYAAKAKQYYEEELKQEFNGSEEQIARVKAKIKDAGMNAWTHYQQFGSAEGVDPSNAFDASAYCAAKALAMNDAGQKDPDGNDWTAESIAKAIDDAGMSVLEHYLTYAGTGEGEVAAGSTYPVADDDQVAHPGDTVVVDGSATTYTGTAGDDTFYVDAEAQLQEYNTLDGGEGNDTLILDNQAQAGTIKNIENLVVRAGNDKTYDLSAFSTSFTLEKAGAKVTVDNVTGQKLVVSSNTNEGSKLTVNTAAGQTSVDLTSQNRSGEQTFDLSGDSLTSVKLAMDEGAKDVAFTGSTAKVTDLAVTATASAAEDDAASIDATALTNLANVTVAGAGAVALTVSAANAALKTVDATANTGGVEVDLSAAPAKAAFTGGAGDDYLKLDDSTAAAHTLGAGDDTVEISAVPTSNDFSVDGGEGIDTLQMTATVAAKFRAVDVVKNFEILNLNGGSGTIDMDNFGDIDHVVVGGATAWTNTLNIDNMANGGTFEYADGIANKTVTIDVKDAKAHDTDVLNVTIAADDDVTTGGLTAADVETINITADDTKLDADGTAGTHTMATLTAAAATTVNISGNAGLTLTNLKANAVETIDASTNTGGVTINSDLGSTVTFKGSAGDDSISANVLSAKPATANDVLTFDGFEAGDTIKMGDSATGLTKLEVSNTALWTEVLSEIQDSVNVWFQYAGNTYVAVSGESGFGGGSDDYIVKLSGTVDLSSASLDGGSLSLPDVEGA